jgi:hypothetical protein
LCGGSVKPVEPFSEFVVHTDQIARQGFSDVTAYDGVQFRGRNAHCAPEQTRDGESREKKVAFRLACGLPGNCGDLGIR